MPSNEAIELLEQVLSENSRTRYLQMQVDKLKDLKEKQDQKEKEFDKAREDLDAVKPSLKNIKTRKELKKVLSNKANEFDNAISQYGDTKDKIGKYSLGRTFSIDPEGDIETVKNAGKNLKDAMEMNKKYHSKGFQNRLSHYTDEISNSNKGKQAYMDDFGGPNSKYNTIHGRLNYENGRGSRQYSSNSGLNNETREYLKMKKRILIKLLVDIN